MKESADGLVALVRADRNAFWALYDRSVERVYRFAYYRTNDVAVSEDIVSDAFMKALSSISSFRGTTEAEWTSWIFAIAYRCIQDQYRRNERAPAELLEGAEIAADTPSDNDRIDAGIALENALSYLDTLPRKHKDIVLMATWDGLSYREIAEIVAESEGNCRQIASRTIRSLEANIAHLLSLSLAFTVLITQ